VPSFEASGLYLTVKGGMKWSPRSTMGIAGTHVSQTPPPLLQEPELLRLERTGMLSVLASGTGTNTIPVGGTIAAAPNGEEVDAVKYGVPVQSADSKRT
jgi:hypothetical protein